MDEIVNQAVAQMGQVTQQNAAWLEKRAAAAQRHALTAGPATDTPM